MKRALLMLMVVMLAATACGESEAEREREEARAGTPCPAASPAISDPALPADFPTLDGVTYVSSSEAGPSQIVEGYREGDLEETYEETRVALGKAPYEVVKTEKDAHDAEVNFSGPNTTGQVRLGEECAGRTSVRITIRPA